MRSPLTGVALSAWGLSRHGERRRRTAIFLAAPGLDDAVDRVTASGRSIVISDIAGYQITYASGGDIEGTVFNRPRFPELDEDALNGKTDGLDDTLYQNRSALSLRLGSRRHSWSCWAFSINDLQPTRTETSYGASWSASRNK